MTLCQRRHQSGVAGYLCYRSVIVLGVIGALWILSSGSTACADDESLTGPETERRFPKLTVPAGFRATLFACDPLVEYPSVIALGPEPGTLFAAYDYMTGLGETIVRHDEIRLLRDRNQDGYADEALLYAGGFNSIQGLAYQSGTVYVMHAPFLTSLKDTDGDGTADERHELLNGLGLPPEENPNRLHCANGVVASHDGWLYLALGDRGCDVTRPEGDRLLFQAGGILRCRPDGRDLHVFSRGLRNIYDIALDAELNVFVRDNENDGGDYMIRVCQSFHGADHGYPYRYQERPDEALPPLTDLGRGSSAGGTAYLEAAFPQEYRESLFFCEWGRAVVRYRKQLAGSSFKPMQEIDFAAGAPDDPYGFKPTDLVVDRDGSLLISDWGDGQRPKRGRGRIYRISYQGDRPASTPESNIKEDSALETLFDGLNSASYYQRVQAQEWIERRGQQAIVELHETIGPEQIGEVGRLHVVWILAHIGGKDELDELLRMASHDADPCVRAQVVRAIADLADPVVMTHRLDGGRGEPALCRRLAELWGDPDPRVRLEVLVALGRLRWVDAPQWLSEQWWRTSDDSVMFHAAMQLLRRAVNWPAVLELLDVGPTATAAKLELRTIALRALADQADESVVDRLIVRLNEEPLPARRREYLDLLTRVHRKPTAWTYWGFRPPLRPVNSVDWERTELIAAKLDAALHDPDIGVRAAVVRRMLREGIPVRYEQLTRWLNEDTSAEGVDAILAAFGVRPAAEVRPALEKIIASNSHVDQNRLAALAKLSQDLDAEGIERLRRSADSLDEGQVLAAVIRELASRDEVNLSSLLIDRLASRNDDVRAAAATALAQRPVPEITSQVVGLLADRDLRVRLAGVTLAGKLNVRESRDDLLAAVDNPDRRFLRAGLESLLLLRDPRAVSAAIAALDVPDAQVAGMAYLGQFGTPEHLAAILKAVDQTRSTEVLSAAIGTLLLWRDREGSPANDRTALDQAIARIHGTSGLPMVWRVCGPLSRDAMQTILTVVAKPNDLPIEPFPPNRWVRKIVSGPEVAVRLEPEADSDQSAWLAVTDLMMEKPVDVEVLVMANTAFTVRFDGNVLFEHAKAGESQRTDHRFNAEFSPGAHRLLVELAGRPETEFRLRFRARSSKAEHERLIKLALEGTGDPDRGREVFLNAEKSQCIRCHRLAEQGGRIGPDLAGIGSRFSRIHLVESVLEPSRTIAPSYESWAVALVSGQVVTGVKSSENETQLILGDNQGKLHEISKWDIDELQSQSQSTMPERLEQRLTDREFLDLIEFLSSQKKPLPK